MKCYQNGVLYIRTTNFFARIFLLVLIEFPKGNSADLRHMQRFRNEILE